MRKNIGNTVMHVCAVCACCSCVSYSSQYDTSSCEAKPQMQTQIDMRLCEMSNNCIVEVIEQKEREIESYKINSKNAQERISEIESYIAERLNDDGSLKDTELNSVHLSIIELIGGIFGGNIIFDDTVVSTDKIESLGFEKAEKSAELENLKKCIDKKEEEISGLRNLQKADITLEEVKLMRLQFLVENLLNEVVVNYGVTPNIVNEAKAIVEIASSLDTDKRNSIVKLQLINEIATRQFALLEDDGIFKDSAEFVLSVYHELLSK
jgi:hypothetical protein